MKQSILKSASIIIPCTRPYLVRAAIDSFLNQVGSLDEYEIIVVGKNSARLKESYAKDNLVCLQPPYSCLPSQARNLGAAQAKAEALIFADDDCQALPRLVDMYLDYLNKRDIGVVTGKIVGKSDTFFRECLNYSNFHDHLSNREKEMERFISATFAIRKEVFDSLGGFDENIAVHEDVDFAWRLRQKGFKIVYSPKTGVFHNHQRDSFVKMITYHYRSGVLGGLSLSVKHQHDLKNKVKFYCRKCYIFLVIPFAVWTTTKAVKSIAALTHKVFLFAPFIFLNQLSYQVGVLRWTLSSKK